MMQRHIEKEMRGRGRTGAIAWQELGEHIVAECTTTEELADAWALLVDLAMKQPMKDNTRRKGLTSAHGAVEAALRRVSTVRYSRRTPSAIAGAPSTPGVAATNGVAQMLARRLMSSPVLVLPPRSPARHTASPARAEQQALLDWNQLVPRGFPG